MLGPPPRVPPSHGDPSRGLLTPLSQQHAPGSRSVLTLYAYILYSQHHRSRAGEPAMTTHAAAVTSIDALRDGRGRFRPGVSGNPAGKPPGTLNQATILKRWMADGDDERLGRQVIERALKGEWAALCFVMERLDPKPRSRPIALDFPDEASFAARCEIVVRAMA